MSSISGSMSAGAMSPADRMQLALQSAVAAGTVNAADQNALSSAISDIGGALKPGGSPAANASAGGIQSKLSSLVDQEVSDGKLTTDQATELKQVFAQAMQKMGSHHHHAKRANDGDADDITSTTTDQTSTASTTGSSTSGNPIDTLISLLKQVEQAAASATNYTANGTSAGSLASSLLVDGQA